jgi:hypothetical protein
VAEGRILLTFDKGFRRTGVAIESSIRVRHRPFSDADVATVKDRRTPQGSSDRAG